MKRLLFVLAIALAGCATPPPQKPQMPPNPALACFRNEAMSPAYAQLARKIYLGSARDQPASMFANTDKLTDQEKPIFLAWVNVRLACDASASGWRQEYLVPKLIAINERSKSEFIALSSDLYSGKITFGEYAQKRLEKGQAAQKEWAAVVQQLREARAGTGEPQHSRTPVYPAPEPQPKPDQMQSSYGSGGSVTRCYAVNDQMRCNSY
jgi:hypothetical protein